MPFARFSMCKFFLPVGDDLPADLSLKLGRYRHYDAVRKAQCLVHIERAFYIVRQYRVLKAKGVSPCAVDGVSSFVYCPHEDIVAKVSKVL